MLTTVQPTPWTAVVNPVLTVVRDDEITAVRTGVDHRRALHGCPDFTGHVLFPRAAECSTADAGVQPVTCAIRSVTFDGCDTHSAPPNGPRLKSVRAARDRGDTSPVTSRITQSSTSAFAVIMFFTAPCFDA
ncbi:hypothetical protein CH305_18140 [Rhodococcus sp. 15-649-2-2]|nr:hypothetical protein CH305_18140 [Rhodococcus sp. 15-649-2-2]